MVTQYLMNRWIDEHLRPRMPQPGVCSAGPAGWACRCFEPGLLCLGLPPQDSKWHPPCHPQCQGARAGPSPGDLGTTIPGKDPETRNKGSSSHVAKAVCHGNIREPLVGWLCNCSGPGCYHLLALPLLHDYVLPGQHKEKTRLQSCRGTSISAKQGLPG